MPKKGTNASRKPSATAAVHMKTHPGRSSSSSRKPSVSFQKQEREEEEMEVEQEDGGEDDVDDNMMEMLTMLQEFQKRKATKSSARSATFQNEKTALFTYARKRAQDAVQNGVASIEKARATIAGLKAQETSQEDVLSRLRMLQENQDESMQGLLGHLNEMIENLSHRRAAQINDTSAMLEGQAPAREKSCRKLIANANARMAENVENQKLATDATALIKHYKALLLL